MNANESNTRNFVFYSFTSLKESPPMLDREARHGKLRFRIKHHDAPEVETSLIFYKIGQRRVQLQTNNVGVAALQYARGLIANCSKVRTIQ